jgi:lysophospholipase L1-like esterase
MAIAELRVNKDGAMSQPRPAKPADDGATPRRNTGASDVCRIAVLGDSTSSGIGLGEKCYPAKLLHKLQNALTVHIANHAVPAITSADASRYFLSEVSRNPVAFLVVYLGCTEGASSFHKGRYRPLRTRFRELLKRSKERRFRPILSPSPFRFQYQLRPATTPTSPDEFRDNLRLIVKTANKAGTNVILINPVANRQFPCGVGAANSSYFCYLDDLERFGCAIENEPVDDATTALAAGLRDFASGRLDEAAKVWLPLASDDGIVGFIARHNIACTRARKGDEGARADLTALLGVSEIYDSIVLYNLAHLSRVSGEPAAYDEYHERALESDISLYRVRRKYREAVASFAGQDGVDIIDLNSILAPSDFIDYCHPSDAGHEKIASSLAQAILTKRKADHSPAASTYEIVLPSPNYVTSPGQTLVDYFCMDWPLEPERIATVVRGHLKKVLDHDTNSDELCASVENFFKVNEGHPIFSPAMTLALPFLMPRSHEILSFPEFYICRLMHNYMREFESAGLRRRVSSGAMFDEVCISADGYRRMILQSGHTDLEGEVDFSITYLDHLLGKLFGQVAEADRMFRPAIGERLRAVLSWYTRESFRYGTHSRPSMLYYRWDIDRISEGICVAMAIANRHGQVELVSSLDRLLSGVVDLVRVHESSALAYHRDPNSLDMAGYEAELRTARRTIQDRALALAPQERKRAYQIG